MQVVIPSGIKHSPAMVRVVLAIVLLALVAACTSPDPSEGVASGGDGGQEEADASTIDRALSICMPPWVNSPPQAYLTKAVLEEKFGNDVEITEADIGPCYSSLSTGDTDILADSWLPATHESYMEEYGEDVEALSPLTPAEPSGLYVPEYVTVDSMEQLNEVKERFGGVITGIEPGAGIMEQTEEAIEEYDLDYELVESSDFAMTAAVGDAVENDEWIVVTSWIPHWMHVEWDMKRLDDPLEVYGDERWLSISVSSDFAEEAPEIVSFLDDWHVDIEVWNELIRATAVEEEEPEVAVEEWMDSNADTVASWVNGS